MGRVTVLHLGPPRSSLNLALNIFRSRAIRSFLFHSGLPHLNRKQQQEVVLGNALAEVTVRLVRVQTQAKGYWHIEQPKTSLLLLLDEFVELLEEPTTYKATRALCNDGAPWQTGHKFVGELRGY